MGHILYRDGRFKYKIFNCCYNDINMHNRNDFLLFNEKMSNINKEQILQLAFIFVYIAVLTMPHMHERYGYLYEIFAIMLALLYKRTIIPCIILQLITFFTYSSYLFKQEHMLTVLAVINIGIFIYYFWIFFVQKENEKTENLCNNN